jgi:O-antigen/teichoic acid export membrane protein
MISLWQFIVAMNGLANGHAKWPKQILKTTNIKLALPLFGIGIRFVLLQLSSVVLFSLGTYLTYSNLSAEDAAKFDVLFKFFQVPLIIFSMIISIYWVEIARDISLRNVSGLTRRYKQLLLMSFGIGLLILVFAFAVMSMLINIYSGNKIQCTNIESITFGIMIVVQIFAYTGAVFLNAAEILKGQIALAILAAFLLIPTAKYFFGIGFGVVSVPLATGILIIPSLIYCNWTAYVCVIKNN